MTFKCFWQCHNVLQMNYTNAFIIITKDKKCLPRSRGSSYMCLLLQSIT